MNANSLRPAPVQVYSCITHIFNALRPIKGVNTFFFLFALGIFFNHQVQAQLRSVQLDLPGTTPGKFKLTSDGNTLIYLVDEIGISNLYSIPVSGGTPVQLNANFPFGNRISDFQISPDGSKVAYSVTSPGPNHTQLTELWVMTITGGSPLQLVPPTGQSIWNFQFTSDGNTIVYRGDQDRLTYFDVYKVAVTGGAPVRISHALSSTQRVTSYTLTSDDSRIVYMTNINSINEIYSAPVAGGAAVRLNLDIPPIVGRVLTFQVSPDGSRVVYSARHNTIGVDEIFSVPTTGGTAIQLNTRLVSGRDVLNYKISPNSTHVVYLADQNTQFIRELYSVPIDGGSVVQLNTALASGTIKDYEISPDGSRVVYIAEQNTASLKELFSVPIAGGSPVLLNGPIDTFGVITFDIASNGNMVAYSVFGQAFAVPVAGGQAPVEVTTGPTATRTFILDIRMSPDGDNVAFVRSNGSTTDQDVFFSPITSGGAINLGNFVHPNTSLRQAATNDLRFLDNSTSIFTITNIDYSERMIISSLSSAISSATLDSPTQITVTFSDNVQTNGGNPTDFTVTDGIGNTFGVSAQADGTAGDADIVLTVADVSTAVGDLTVTYTNNNGEITNLVTSDPVDTDDTGVMIDTDMTAPTLVSAVKDSDTQITVTLSEPVQTQGSNPTDFTVTDGLGTDFAVSAQADGTAQDTDIVLTVADLSGAVGDLTVTYTNNNNEISDFGENDLATDVIGVNIDTDNTAPTLVSATKDSDTQITITLSESVQTNGTNPVDFSVTDGIGTDFVVSSQADGTANDTDIVLTVADLSTTVGDLTVTYANNNNEVSDFGGNNLATDATGVSIDNDNTAPTLVSATKNSDTQITITLSEQVQTNGTNPGDFTVTDGLGSTYVVSTQADGTAQDTDIVLTVADLSAAVGDLTITYANNNSEISDFGNNDLATDATGVVIDTDMAAPAMVSAVKNSDTQITLTFSEPVQTNGTNPADFTVVDDNSTPFAVSAQAAGTAEDTKIVLTVADLSSAVTQLTITYTNNNNEIADFGGNNMASDATGVVILLDITPPDVTLTTMASDPHSGAFDIIATFTEDVMNITTSDFNVTNGAATAVTGSGAVYTVTITPAADGTVTVDLPANTVQDLANNDNTASNTISLENDETAPTVTITTAASDPIAGAFDITITFSEVVAGFDLTDLMVANGVAGNFAGSGTGYTATITPVADGQVTVDINAGVCQDAATNGNTAATQFSITNDETRPSVTISTTDTDPTSGAFTATFTFDEAVTGFALGDITVSNGAASGLTGSGTTYMATITPAADGTVTVDVAGNVAQDAAGNDNTAATQFSIENDETAPAVTITSSANDPVNGAFDITITFSEAVTGFDMTDLTLANGTVSSFAGSGMTYTSTITPVTDGIVTVDVAATAAQDAAGNDNTAATQFGIQADLTAPAAPVITGISDDTGTDNTDGITSDNTLIFNGTAEANSTVEVFIDGGSIGTTTADGTGNWTYDHSGSALSDAGYNITATAMDAATNTSAVSTTFTVIVDQAVPGDPSLGSISDDTGISNTDIITNDPTLIYSGTAEPFATITVGAGPFTLQTTTADANGDWIADVTFRPFTSSITVFITATDAAGNASPNTNTFLITIDTILPTVQSIVRADPNPTAASTVDYTVTFSEEVHGLSTGNFSLALTGTQNANIASVSTTSGTSVTVTVDNITGEGSFGLNLTDLTGITDVAGNGLDATFTGEVYNTNFTPTDITLSASSILENNAVGDLVAMLTTTDNDAGDTHTYSLVAGTGDTDNASFTIAGDELKAAEAFDLETKASYDIRIQTDDGRGGTFEKAFTINIDNVPEADLRITGDGNIPATPLGITTTFDVTIHNDGDAALNVTSILYPAAFGGPVAGITVAPASSQVVTMTFTPTVAQLYTGDITINSNGGTGILSVSADGAIITAIDDGLLRAESINIYPNPATDIVTIDLSKYNGRALDIQLYDMSGTEAFGISDYKATSLKLDVSRYHNGLYLVQLTDGKNTVQKKIMIRK